MTQKVGWCGVCWLLVWGLKFEGGGGGCPDFNNATDTDKLPTHCATTASLLLWLFFGPIDSQCEVWHMPTDASTDHLHVLCGDYLIWIEMHLNNENAYCYEQIVSLYRIVTARRTMRTHGSIASVVWGVCNSSNQRQQQHTQYWYLTPLDLRQISILFFHLLVWYKQ